MGQHNLPIVQTEGFDTVKLKWFKMQSLEKPRHSTSAVVMNNQAIYLMPGNPLGIGAPTASATNIFVLDLKNANKFDKNDLNYVRTLSQEKWSSLTVQDVNFNKLPPTAAVSINAVEMLIFGGHNQRCYTFNV